MHKRAHPRALYTYMPAFRAEGEPERKRSLDAEAWPSGVATFDCSEPPSPESSPFSSWKRAFEWLHEYYEISDTQSSHTRERVVRRCISRSGPTGDAAGL